MTETDNGLYSIDYGADTFGSCVVLYKDEHCLGVLRDYAPDGQTRRHTESLHPDLGKWVQLTGTLFALGTPDGIDYKMLGPCPGYCGRGALRCPKATVAHRR